LHAFDIAHIHCAGWTNRDRVSPKRFELTQSRSGRARLAGFVCQAHVGFGDRVDFTADRQNQFTAFAETLDAVVKRVLDVYVAMAEAGGTVDRGAPRLRELPSARASHPRKARPRCRADLKRIARAVAHTPAPRTDERPGGAELVDAVVCFIGDIDVTVFLIDRDALRRA